MIPYESDDSYLDTASLEDQAAQEGYAPEYQPDEEPAEDFPFDTPDESTPRMWLIMDSIGQYHDIAADHIHYVDGYVAFWRDGTPLNDLVASFYQPIAVTERG